MNESRTERKRLLSLVIVVFVISLTIRATGDHRVPPFDDLYHLKRIEFSAAHFPRVLELDPDRGERGAFCPWPPLYDLALAPFAKVIWIPPLFFAAFAAAVTAMLRPFGLLAAATGGLTLALSPYLIGASSVGHIDHHYVEPLLLLLIVVTAARRNGLLLALAITLALFIQTAMIVAAALAFLVMLDHPREGAKAFAIPALAIVVYSLTLPSSYPASPWFLGLPHAALLCGAAIACAARSCASRWTALAAGTTVALAFAPTATALLAGLHFFGRDPWLSSIIEFQPMFRDVSQIGTDIANLTGGALLVPLLWRKQRTFTIFSIAYLLLAISSRRFLVPAIALFAIGGALAAAYAHRRALAIAAMTVTLLPPVIYDVYAARIPEPSNDEFRVIGERMRALPRGRVLGPWSFGHAIDVIGQKPVIIDNFGSMPDERVFTQAIEAMLATRESSLLDYCRSRGVRYLVLPHPAYIPATAATIGIDRELYSRTRLARRTVWSRLYRGEKIAGFALVNRAALSIWKIE
ncbi:MAG TPA: hypothetical protein VGK31_11460 [Thermoanaerobaculia bacterium]